MSVILRILTLIFKFFKNDVKQAATEANKATDAERVPDATRNRFKQRVRDTLQRGGASDLRSGERRDGPPQ